MNVFDIAQSVNDRLNGGDEGKFPVTFTVVNEILAAHKISGLLKGFARMVSEGDFDEEIMSRVRVFNDENLRRLIMFDDEDELSMMIHLHRSYANTRRTARIASIIIKMFGSVVFLGSAIVVGRMVRWLTSL